MASDAPLVAFHAGESQGLEFLSDICQPVRGAAPGDCPDAEATQNRPFKGNIYIIGRQRSHLPDSETARVLESRSRLAPRVSDALVRCYFHYVHPFLPLINAADFLQTYDADPDKISPLLLWSVYFAAASVSRAILLVERH